tara:strand:+ start:307 stop:666 length:360 start_codon:yes stop_codon:yes gene_type:complete
MEDNDKKPSTLEKVIENLTQPVSSGTSKDVPPGAFATGSNIREVDFKNKSNDIVQTLGADTDAILITYERDKGELKLYHNGVEIDKAVFAKTLKAETSFFAMFDYVQEKFKSWRDAWVN